MIIAFSLHASVPFAAGYLVLVMALILKKRPLLAACIFLACTAWLVYSPSLLYWAHYLGSDSFSEAQSFNLAEALNFLQSLNHVTLHWRRLLATALTIVLGLCSILAVRVASARLLRVKLDVTSWPVVSLAAALVIGPTAAQLHPTMRSFQSNSKIYKSIHDNFHLYSDASVVPFGSSNELNVIVYIGESTGSLNMGLYGYPRNTTPELERFARENNNLLVFHKVFSTHSHTSPSLLEALSVGVDQSEDYYPIDRRRRVSIIDLLNQAGIPSALISNQARAGTWNEASSIIFRNTEDKVFSLETSWLGAMEEWAARPLDHKFLIPKLDERGELERAGPKVLFLHSYAGHGPYLRNIDAAFRQPVDDFLERRPATAIVGNELAGIARVVPSIEAFDSAVRYVDHCIVSVLRRIKASSHPTVFVYFSDHGESVYSHRGHDSSRFLHDMVRIPFLVYFNDAAAATHSEILEQFRGAALARRVSTLAQFPASLLALFGLQVEGGSYQGIGLDELVDLPPILTRETSSGYTYIPLGERRDRQEVPSDPRDAADPHTKLFRAAQRLEAGWTNVCQQRSHTIGKALRGAMVADCLWVDVVVGTDGVPAINAAANRSDSLDLEAITDIVRSLELSIWIAGGNLTSARECSVMDAYFEGNSGRSSPNALIVFPGHFPFDDTEFRECLVSLRARGISTGLELPAVLTTECAEDLGKNPEESPSCPELSRIIRETADSGIFTDLVIDFSAAMLVESLKHEIGLSWNAWNVPIVELDSERVGHFRRVAVELTEDPNGQ